MTAPRSIPTHRQATDLGRMRIPDSKTGRTRVSLEDRARRAVESPATRILGIDPGSQCTGWGIVDARGTALQGIATGVVRVRKEPNFEQRLLGVHQGLVEVINTWKPTHVAIEDIFFAKGFARSALMLGHARGVAMLAAAAAGLRVETYPASVVKRSVGGHGRSEKAQVARIVSALLKLKKMPGPDATDALAIAITHARCMHMPQALR